MKNFAIAAFLFCTNSLFGHADYVNPPAPSDDLQHLKVTVRHLDVDEATVDPIDAVYELYPISSDSYQIAGNFGDLRIEATTQFGLTAAKLGHFSSSQHLNTEIVYFTAGSKICPIEAGNGVYVKEKHHKIDFVNEYGKNIEITISLVSDSEV